MTTTRPDPRGPEQTATRNEADLPVRLPTEDDLPRDQAGLESFVPTFRFPTEDDVVTSDGVPLDSDREALQINLLKETLRLAWADRDDFYIAGNMFVYFDLDQYRNLNFRGPDIYVALGVPKHERKAWLTWVEGKAPDVVIEFLSESTAAVDRGVKKQVYQDQLRAAEYVWYDPFTRELAGFRLVDGVYEPIVADERGRLVSRRLRLALAVHEGVYGDVEAPWLRWETLAGEVLPTAAEVAVQERARADEAMRRVAELEAELARLRAAGGEPA
jgi:Uma2 family endonuclease